MFVERAYFRENDVPDDAARAQWPYTVPCIDQLLETGLELEKPVTIFVGDNGSGKSTLVEAIAEAFGLDSAGGRLAVRQRQLSETKSALGQQLALRKSASAHRMLAGPRLRKQGFFLRAETAYRLTALSGVPGYWEENTAEMSHGEGFLTMFATMFDKPGFYVMDEPEGALSFTSCLQLVSLIHELGQSGSQVLFATHSPILAAIPGADLIEVGDHGFRHTTWQELQLVDHWRRFLEAPDRYLQHLVGQ